MIARIAFVALIVVIASGLNVVFAGHTTLRTPVLIGLVALLVLVSVIAAVLW